MLIPHLNAPLMLTAAPSSAPPPPPTSTRVATISQWLHYFHNTRGQFRSPSTHGAELEHLDIDITVIEPQARLANKEPLFLPKVAILTLRGGDLMDDDDERMECLSEVLAAIRPLEVRWLSNTTASGGGYSPTAHLVHHTVLEAGERWSAKGMLRKLVLQGGFPSRTCPDVSVMNHNQPLDFAFRTWSVEEVHWQLDNFTPAAAVTIVQHYLQAIHRAFWQGTNEPVQPPTRALTFASVPFEALDRIRALPAKLRLPDRATEWIQDVSFIGKGDSVSRLWGEHPPVDERLLARLRAELLVAQERRILPMAMLWA